MKIDRIKLSARVFSLFLCFLILIGLLNYGIWYNRSMRPSQDCTYTITEHPSCFPSWDKKNLSLSTTPSTIQFQHFDMIWSGLEQILFLRFEKEEKSLTVYEIYNGSTHAKCLSLYNISGEISNLKEGNYKITFIFTAPSLNITTKLYKKHIFVETSFSHYLQKTFSKIDLSILLTLGLLTGGIVIFIALLLLLSLKKQTNLQ